MELFGKKVLLSKVASHDVDFICRIECDSNLWYFEEYVESDKNVIYEEYIRKIKDTEQPTSYDFIVSIVVDKNKIPIGLAQIWNNSEYRKSWEIGFAILPSYQRKGYGTEAIQLLLQFAFEKLDAHKVVGMCNEYNISSAILMERVGMRREAIFKEELFWQNKWVDQYYFSILEREYFGRN
ncbi:GNAT family protein [Bacillus cytotoxicus]|uniref:GNAT family N-acetyltransferase n=1 Tax=Bacillus cereus group sp. BfR-BA-01492 TaxID=2920361 RepID=UPI001F5823F5|nr:GNAT family protein [Bacillus cereus group sp. BfR-BA-01492]EMA6343527.1 GNAT family N-acetyltransferase [Bacillus cytotoxicus]